MGNTKTLPVIALAAAMASIASAAPASASAHAGDARFDLDWLAGQWCGGDEDSRIEEAWLPEAGGSLLGMSRTVRGGRTASFEFMRVVLQDGRASFHVQPDGAPPTVFVAAERGDGWIRFENPAHDFPNVIEYRRNGEGLSAWISGPGRDGKALRIAFEYRACAAVR
jgi:hypothetical protein